MNIVRSYLCQVNNILDLKPVLHGPSKKFFITTHHKPDGDAMGSSLGLYHYLKKLGHQPTVVTPNDYGSFLFFLPGEKSVIQYESDPQQAFSALKDCDYIFCLDFNRLSRINELGDAVRAAQQPKIMIDHHLEPEDFAQFQLHDSKAAATAELIFQLMVLMGDLHLMDAEIGTCLYTGIMTDTGSFRFASTSAEIHRTIAFLKESGVDHVKIHEAINDSWSFRRLQFMGYVLANKLQYLPEKKTAYITITAQELLDYDVQTGDTEGLVNYALSIEGVKFAALMVDRTVMVKISFRSKGTVPANEFSAMHFKGGGHLNAAGGQSSESLEVTERRFLEALENFYPQIIRDEKH